jgi:EpsI family protein
VIRRLSILSIFLLLGAAVIAKASRTEQVPPREPLARFPSTIGSWKGQDTAPFSKEVLAVLGVDEYLIRVYHTDRRNAVGLYIGYYESQRQGDTIHSPLNCLPGAGWQPVSKSYVPISVVDSDNRPSTITVNRYVIEKGIERQVVLYWYQSHGRAIANEYRSKVLMVYDAVRLNRSDAALVRVISPSIPSEDDGETAADVRTVEFVKAMFPLLGRFLPS